MKFLTVLLILSFLLRDAKCLASTSDSSRPPTTRVISVKKNGGEVKVFEYRVSNAAYKVKTGLWYIPSLQSLRVSVLRKKGLSTLRSTFFPSGYPSRTPPGYLRYCMCSWIQDLSTQLRSVLATQRVLEGVGVGREGATALSALMNYLVRDGCGMVATLLFTSAASSKFRVDVKRWRLFADLMVDIGITLEVMAVVVPKAFFLPMISVGNMCKAMCGVAAGACGGSINLHWAKGSDISDINAKFGAQHTVTGALGLIFAAFFARSVDHVNASILWSLYATLTLLHLVANAWCMRLIAFDSCNTARMNLLLGEFFDWWETEGTKGSPEPPTLSSPEVIAKKEPLLFFPGKASKAPAGVPVRIGVSFEDFWEATGQSFASVQQVQSVETVSERYLVAATTKPHSRTVSALLVTLLAHVSGREEAKAYFHANWLGRELRGAGQSLAGLPSKVDVDDNALARAWRYFEISMEKAGWDLGKTELSTIGYEVEFAS